jgi:hypothetical protein
VPLSIDVSSTTIFPEHQPGSSGATRPPRHATDVAGFLPDPRHATARGREFEWRDDRQAPRVAIVNLTFARTILRAEHPLGQRFSYGPGGPPVEVIGVVEDGKYVSLSEAPRATVFDPILQSPSTNVVLLARAATPEAENGRTAPRTVRALDPRLSLYQTESLREMLGFVLFPSRAAAVALSTFGLLAALLAGTGIYGVVAYAVARRVREIGVRIAIGARPGQILSLVFLRIGVLMLTGGAMRLGLALVLSRLMATIVYQAPPTIRSSSPA